MADHQCPHSTAVLATVENALQIFYALSKNACLSWPLSETLQRLSCTKQVPQQSRGACGPHAAYYMRAHLVGTPNCKCGIGPAPGQFSEGACLPSNMVSEQQAQ